VPRHDPRKGLHVLLRALARLDAVGVRYRACLVGPGRLLGAHRDLAASLGLAGRVAIPGAGRRGRPLPAARRRVDAALAPGGQRIGVPRRGTRGRNGGCRLRCDGIPEDLVDGRHAVLVPPDDPCALADALSRMLDDPPLRAALAARGRRLFEERFSPEPFVTALRDIYAEVVAVLAARPQDPRSR
jgi:glycogen(starch) synthase